MKKTVKPLCLLFLIMGIIPLHFEGRESIAETELSQKAANSSHEFANPAQLEAFLDGVMLAHMKENHIAGATFALVKNGEIFLKKGYGYADVEKKIPVSPDTTLFRPGSVSKLFTWTAVMQLYEEGKLDLDADVNTYLKDFKIPDTFPQPITMKHLMSHTPGFEEVGGIWAGSADELVPLAEQLEKKIPARVFPPGEVAAYSNYGTALAGYIVEIISGVPFVEYIEKNIFEPLDMDYSTFRQPLPGHLKAHMSVGYNHEKGVYVAKDFEFVNGIEPAGSMSGSAVDMAKFAIAHLQKGRYKDRRILKEETAELMHSRLFSHHPKLWGNAHGFWEHDMNRLDIIEHGGDTLWFHSFFVLLPEKNIGFFLSYNSVGGAGSSREDFLQALLDRYYPVPPAAKIKPPADFTERAGRYTGTYAITRSIYTKYTKIMRLLMNINITATEEGTLLVKAPMGMDPIQMVEVEPLVFREVDGPGLFVFEQDERGRITHGFVGPSMALEKLSWYQAPVFHYFVLGISLILFLTALRWPLGALFRKICKKTMETGAGSKAARWVLGMACLLNGVFVIGLAVTHAGGGEQLIYGVPPAFKILLFLPLIAIVLLLVSVVYMIMAWSKKYWSGCARLHYTLIVLACIVFVWFLNYWNMIGFKY